jgi:hypothetical protein
MRCKHGCQGHHHHLDISDGHSCLLGLLLRILHHVDKLGDAIGLGVILMHVGLEANHVNCMQPPTVGVEEGHDVQCRDLHVESLGVLEVIIPDLLDGFAEEFGNPPLSCLVTGVVIKA